MLIITGAIFSGSDTCGFEMVSKILDGVICMGGTISSTGDGIIALTDADTISLTGVETCSLNDDPTASFTGDCAINGLIVAILS